MGSVSTGKSLARLRRGGAGGTLSHFLATKWVAYASPISSSSYSFSSAASVASSSGFQPSPPSSEIEGKSSRWSKWFLFLPGAITFGLGTWQIFRRQEKIKMLDYREKRLQMEPLKFSSASPSAEELDSLEFRKAVCKGVYDDKKSIFVGPRSRSISGVTENGYYLITPLMPAPSCPDSVSFPVIVNRGWVPRSWRDKFVEASQDGEQSSEPLPSPLQAGGTKSWWRFWSRKPDITEVLSSFWI
ncbi:surfeit locus protein 1 [Neltuma alba]|uniref:surfeit locus protein 1 n=1 Tax=Neltuma alba TaxID=207710 RepID=UPI0010A39D12|nr:surfeit locus protein 1-like [Prosopis alba]